VGHNTKIQVGGYARISQGLYFFKALGLTRTVHEMADFHMKSKASFSLCVWGGSSTVFDGCDRSRPTMFCD